MGTKKQHGLIGLFALLVLLCGLPLLSPVDEARADHSKIEVYWGTDIPRGEDGNGGVVTPNDGNSGETIKRDSGTSLTLTITPDTGYVINDIWLDDGNGTTSKKAFLVNKGSYSTYTFDVGNRDDWKFYADFAPSTANYNVVYSIVVPSPACTAADLTCTAGSNGKINTFTAAQLPKTATVAKFASTSFTFTPDAGYVVQDVHVSDNDGGTWVSQGAVTSYTFTDVLGTRGNSRIRVSFQPQGYNITAAVGANGSMNPGGAGPVTSGLVPVQKNADQLFTITPNTNYRVLDVSVIDLTAGYTTSTSLGAITSYTFKNVTADGNSISVTFAPIISSNIYCQIPPFVGSATSLAPNVMLVFDTSGSMAWDAYTNLTYDKTKTFYGYFDITKMYKLSGGTYSIDTTKTLDLTSSLSGNKLNYLYMHRIDVVRKALIGGKVSHRVSTGGPLPMTINMDNGSNILVEKNPTTGILTEPTGIVQQIKDKVRFGLMFFNSGDGGYVAAPIGDTPANIVASIEAKNPSGHTPMAETLYEALRYFQMKKSAYNGTVDYGDGTWADPIKYPCQKSFVILISDGLPNDGGNLPGVSSMTDTVTDAATKFNATTWLNKIPASERGQSDSGGTEWVEAVAYYAHNTDLRSPTVGKADMSGTQNLTFYTVFAFGTTGGSQPLKTTAKYGGYDDKNNNAKPDLAIEWNKSNNGIPDNYLEAGEGDSLESGLLTTIANILAKVSSGTAASILSNSEGSGANILQAVFYPDKIFEKSTEAVWLGELHSMWYYIDPFMTNSSIREDTDYFGDYRTPPDVPITLDADHKLNLLTDLAATFRFDGTQTVVDLAQDTNGDGAPDLTLNTVSPDEVKSIWRAGKKLWARTTARNILTPCLSTATSTPVCTDGLMSFSDIGKNVDSMRPYLQAADATESAKIINYARGTDQTGYRSRTVTLLTGLGVYDTREWKLGDIISSTPRIQSNTRLNAYSRPYPTGYGDKSYGDEGSKAAGFIYTSSYKARGMVYVGANDGMLHAFKLGLLDVASAGDKRATLSGTSLGEEAWAFVPKNTLPYLKYMTEPGYSHLYYVDGTPMLVDASIGSCASGNYWDCDKDTATGSTWRTILVSGMGTGGASRVAGTSCTNCVVTPITDPADATHTKGLGYSSYFALDVTDQNNPKFLWEFNDPGLGFSTTGPAIVRLSAIDASSKPVPNKNGRWFAIFASGPTGPIDQTTHQFQGNSDQHLMIYVVDLKTGAVTATIDSGISQAFAGAITNAPADTDRWNGNLPGFYQDDVLYIGYSQYLSGAWTGGVLRLVNNEKLDTSTGLPTWTLSKVIDNIGPVTTNIARLQDRKNHNFWLYFGTGRYFYSLDDQSAQRKLIAMKEPCYLASDKLDQTCTTTKALGDLTNQDAGTAATISSQGWYLTLDAENVATTLGAERVITDPVAMTNGAVFFTTFKPTANICSFGGVSSMWAMKYDTGLQAPAAALNGKALIQVSTGAFVQVDLKTAFTDKLYRRMGTAMTGKPPSDPPPIISNAALKPVKRILHIQER